MTKIIAHRGASRYAPENTIAAFQKAIELGADMVEFDVRKTKDGVFIIHHDAKIKRKKIINLTLAEIKKIKAEIPTLEETLIFLQGKIQLDIELKEEGYEEKLLAIVLKHFTFHEFIICSFRRNSVKMIKEKFPQVKAGLLIGAQSPRKILRTRVKEIFPFRFLQKNKIDFLIAHRVFSGVNIIKRAQRKNFPLIVWGVNSRKIFAKLLQQNVFGIITDYPDIGR